MTHIPDKESRNNDHPTPIHISTFHNPSIQNRCEPRTMESRPMAMETKNNDGDEDDDGEDRDNEAT